MQILTRATRPCVIDSFSGILVRIYKTPFKKKKLSKATKYSVWEKGIYLGGKRRRERKKGGREE